MNSGPTKCFIHMVNLTFLRKIVCFCSLHINALRLKNRVTVFSSSSYIMQPVKSCLWKCHWWQLHGHGYEAVWQQCLCFASAFPLCFNVDIDQLKLIMLLVGTPGPELLMKMSSETVSVMFGGCCTVCFCHTKLIWCVSELCTDSWTSSTRGLFLQHASTFLCNLLNCIYT